MSSSLEVVDQDLPADSGFVPQPASGRELGLEVIMGTDQLTRMRLARVNEDPEGIGISICRFAQQRTLCRTVWSGERAEFQHHVALGPEVRQPYGAFIVESNE